MTAPIRNLGASTVIRATGKGKTMYVGVFGSKMGGSTAWAMTAAGKPLFQVKRMNGQYHEVA